MTDKELKEMSELKGFEVKRNKQGFVVVSCHYSADPDKDQAWEDKMRNEKLT